MNKKAFVILAVVVLLLAGGIALVSLWPFGSSDGDGETVQTDDGGDLLLYAATNGTVSSVSISPADGESFSLVLSGGLWSCPEKPGAKLDGDKLSTVVSVFTGIYAERIVTEQADDLSQFGLDAPLCSVTVVNAAGESTSFAIGMKNPVLGSYYFKLEGDSRIYLISADTVETLMTTPAELAAYDQLPLFDYADVTDLVIKNSSGILDFALWTEPNENCYTDSYTWFASDGMTALSEDAVNALIADIMEIYINSVADADPADLSLYGLEDGGVYINVNYLSGETPGCLSLSLGDLTEDGSMRYAMTDRSETVFYIEADLVEFADAITLDNFLPSEICLITLSEVDSVTVEMGDVSFELVVTREYITQGESGSSVLVGTSYTVNGNRVSEEKVTALFTVLGDLTADGSTDSTEGELVARMTFVRNTDRFSEMTLSVYSYNTSFCRVSFNGNSGMLINRKSADSFLSAITALAE